MAGRVQRTTVKVLPDDVEGHYWRRGWLVGLLCGLGLWWFSAADGWGMLGSILFGG